MQVLAPEEEEFPFRRPARFRNLENLDRALRIDPRRSRNAYLERFRGALRRRSGRACLAIRADYHKVSTAVPVETDLAGLPRGAVEPGDRPMSWQLSRTPGCCSACSAWRSRSSSTF